MKPYLHIYSGPDYLHIYASPYYLHIYAGQSIASPVSSESAADGANALLAPACSLLASHPTPGVLQGCPAGEHLATVLLRNLKHLPWVLTDLRRPQTIGQPTSQALLKYVSSTAQALGDSVNTLESNLERRLRTDNPDTALLLTTLCPRLLPARF